MHFFLVMVVIVVMMPLAFTSASFPLLFELMAPLPGLTAVLAVTPDCLIEFFFGLMDFSFAFIVTVEGLHGKHAGKKKERAQQ